MCNSMSKSVHTLIKKPLLIKIASYHLSFQWVIIFAAGGSCFSVNDCWLIKVVVAEVWSDHGNFLTGMKFSTSIESLIYEQFLCACRAVW